MVKKYDHVVSDDLYHWLDYTGVSEEKFWITADKFRDPNIWWIENEHWHKENIWGKSSSYGKVTKNSVDERKYIKNFQKKKKLFHLLCIMMEHAEYKQLI